jgi:hypothetical protein
LKIPKKIKISGITYKVKRDVKFDDDREGDLDWEKATIRVKGTMCSDAEAITFLHEVIHGIDFSYFNGKIKENFGEDGIDVIANALHQVLPQLEV